MHYSRNRLLTRVTPPAIEPVTLSEAKLYLRIDNTDEDTLITDLIKAARMSAEDWLKRSLITQSWMLTYDGSWQGLSAFCESPLLSARHDHHTPWVYDMVPLPMGPVTNVTNVTIVNRDGSTVTIDPSTYYLNAANNELILTTMATGFRVQITYGAGYGSAESAVPTPIKQGILTHIGDLYDNRGADGNLGLPLQTLKLYLPFREVRL